MSVNEMCVKCEGLGKYGGGPCTACDGRGQVPVKSGLMEAEGLVRGPRHDDYGTFHHEADKIRMIYVALGGDHRPADPGSITSGQLASGRSHALYMMVVKLVRESNRHKRDNIVDLMGYAQLYLDSCEQ